MVQKANRAAADNRDRSGSGADELLIASDDHITTLTLNRPDQYNALSESLLNEMLTALQSAASSKTCRVVVLAANGKAFCAGHDLKQMRANPGRGYQHHLFSLCSEMMMTMTQIPQVVIAKVQGAAVAAGCQMVANADLAIAADSAKFAVSGINLGLFCGTPSIALTRNVPRKRALDMLFRGTSIDAATAAQYSLINECVPAAELDEATTTWAQTIAGKSFDAIAMGKRLYYRQIDQSLPEAYRSATEMMADNMLLDCAQQGIDDFINKKS